MNFIGIGVSFVAFNSKLDNKRTNATFVSKMENRSPMHNILEPDAKGMKVYGFMCFFGLFAEAFCIEIFWIWVVFWVNVDCVVW